MVSWVALSGMGEQREVNSLSHVNGRGGTGGLNVEKSSEVN